MLHPPEDGSSQCAESKGATLLWAHTWPVLHIFPWTQTRLQSYGGSLNMNHLVFWEMISPFMSCLRVDLRSKDVIRKKICICSYLKFVLFNINHLIYEPPPFHFKGELSPLDPPLYYPPVRPYPYGKNFLNLSLISSITSSLVAISSRIHAENLNWLAIGRSVGSNLKANSISDLKD